MRPTGLSQDVFLSSDKLYRTFKILPVLACLSLLSTACAMHRSASYHQSELPSTQERVLTLGLVQSQIRPGMTGAQVASILGSPNIVTSANNGGEAWIYDKIAQESGYSQSTGDMSGLMVGAGSGLAGIGLGTQTAHTGAASSTERSLTVVIQLNGNRQVEDVKYHQSRF